MPGGSCILGRATTGRAFWQIDDTDLDEVGKVAGSVVKHDLQQAVDEVWTAGERYVHLAKEALGELQLIVDNGDFLVALLVHGYHVALLDELALR